MRHTWRRDDPDALELDRLAFEMIEQAHACAQKHRHEAESTCGHRACHRAAAAAGRGGDGREVRQ